MWYIGSFLQLLKDSNYNGKGTEGSLHASMFSIPVFQTNCLDFHFNLRSASTRRCSSFIYINCSYYSTNSWYRTVRENSHQSSSELYSHTSACHTFRKWFSEWIIPLSVNFSHSNKRREIIGRAAFLLPAVCLLLFSAYHSAGRAHSW